MCPLMIIGCIIEKQKLGFLFSFIYFTSRFSPPGADEDVRASQRGGQNEVHPPRPLRPPSD